MKKKSFKNFLMDYTRSMSPVNSLGFMNNKKYVSNDNRLLTLFSLYVLFDAKATKYLVENKHKLTVYYDMYLAMRDKYKLVELDNVNEFAEKFDSFDDLRKVYNSYKNTVLDKDEKLKRIFYNKIKKMQQECKTSTYRIYTDLKLNPGNANDFIKNGNLKKLSLHNVRRINNYLYESA